MDSAIIDVAIAIIFLYLTLSLVVSTITEFMARSLRLRSKNLKTGLEELLGADYATKILESKLSSTTDKPDNIDPKSFSLALLTVLAENQPAPPAGSPPAAAPSSLLERAIAGAPPTLRPMLDSMMAAGEENFAKVREEIETWFDSSMTYVAAMFRAYTRWITLGAAAVVVLLLNADTIMLANIVWKDAATRDAIVAAAGARIESETKADESDKKADKGKPATVQDVAKAVESQLAPFPIGWDMREHEKWPPEATSTQSLKWPKTTQEWFLKTLGIVITFLAVSLGAPFWFDVLKRVMRLRTEIDLAKKKLVSKDNA